MKITIAFTDPEKEEAVSCVAALRRLQPRMKVRKSDRHSPFNHIYVTIPKPAKPCDSKENP